MKTSKYQISKSSGGKGHPSVTPSHTHVSRCLFWKSLVRNRIRIQLKHILNHGIITKEPTSRW